MERMRLHREYCWSGINGGRNCGVTYERKREKVGGHWVIGMWALGPAVNGDSGGPVWDQKTKKIVGILSAANRISKEPCGMTP